MARTSLLPSQPETNPIYFFVRDIIEKKSKTESLRQIADQHWRALKDLELAEPAKKIFDACQELPELESFNLSSISSSTAIADSSFDPEVALLNFLFISSPVDAKFHIVSSNVFAHTSTFCIPAEIGIVCFSFRNGVEGSLQTMINPGKIPTLFIKDALDRCDDYHKIPLQGLKYPTMPILLRAIYDLVQNPGSLNGGTGWIIIEDDEYEETRSVMEFLVQESTRLQLNINWNLQFFKLSSLLKFLRYHFKEQPEENEVFFFKSSRYDYIDLCAYHSEVECRHCALSKAHRYSYILGRNFCPKFGIQCTRGQHVPLRNFIYPLYDVTY